MDFTTWFTIGYHHIITIEALDHLLYIFALCLAFPLQEWKKLLVLITAFTIGHSITLALVSLKIVNINVAWVEFFIPITIAITALLHILTKTTKKRPIALLYLLALTFGLVHGMAYGANDLSSLYEGKELLWNVLAFNLGVEAAQVIVLAWFLGLMFVVDTLLPTASFAIFIKKYWRICLSSFIFCYAIFLAIKNLP